MSRFDRRVPTATVDAAAITAALIGTATLDNCSATYSITNPRI